MKKAILYKVVGKDLQELSLNEKREGLENV